MFFRFMRGRFTFKIYFLLTIIALLTIFAYLFPHFKFYPIAPVTVPPNGLQSRTTRHLSKLLTVVFRQFEEFENDIADSVQSFVSAFPNMPVVILCQGLQYPPFQFSATNETLRNVKIVPLEFRLNALPHELNPLTYLNTEYVLIVPDSTRVSRRVLQQMATAATTFPSQGIAVGVTNSRLICQKVKWNYVDWTLQYSKDPSGKLCDAIHGQHALLIKTSLLQTFPQPFAFPFPESLYLQTTVRKIKVIITKCVRNPVSYSSQ